MMQSEQAGSPQWDRTVKIVVAVFSIILIGLAMYVFRVVFVPLILAAIIAYVLTPVARRISRLSRLPHGLTTGLVFVVLLAILIPAGIIGVQALVEQTNLLVGEMITYIQDLNARSADTFQIAGFEIVVGDVINEITSAVVGTLRSVATSSVGLVLRSARTVLFGVFTLVLGFYMTRDSDKITASIMGVILPAYREDGLKLLGEINRVWSAFLRGQVILSLTVMVILTVVSALLGLPQPLLLGVWGGLLEFLPSIGNMIWGGTAILLAVIEGSSYLPFSKPVFIVIVVIAYVAFSQVDINILIPNIIGGQVKLHPMVVLIGVIVGLTVGGVLGVALAAPTIATIRVVGRYVYAKLFDIDPFPELPPDLETRRARAGSRVSRASSGVFVRQLIQRKGQDNNLDDPEG